VSVSKTIPRKRSARRPRSSTPAASSHIGMPNGSFWKGRRVFLTGHTGFKGSWLSLWLNALGADVTGYSLKPPTEPSLFEQARISKVVKSVCADIRDFPRLKSAIAESKPEVILHMAAQSVVRRGYEDPIETYSSNVMGTVHLLEAVRQLGKPCALVNVTSDKCYENKEWAWGYRENDRLGGHDPYSNSKACAELVASAFCNSYFQDGARGECKISIASVRAGNVIGGGDWTRDQLIPDLIRSFLQRNPCLIRSPSAIRPWQFVLEPLRGYLLVAEKLSENHQYSGSAWNFGPADGDAKTVSWIAERLSQKWGSGASWNQDGGTHPHEAHYLKLDVSKARSELGWGPALDLSTALDWIIEWYRAYHAGADLSDLTRQQIERYEGLLTPQAGRVKR
jgi:CDP-glucose 4,6-dehydratase